MNEYIKNLTGLTDNLIKFSPKFKDSERIKVIQAVPSSQSVHHQFERMTHNEVYLRQSYPSACPHCGRLMRKNGFKTVYLKGLDIAGLPTILVVEKQKYICPRQEGCPELTTDLARIHGIDKNHQILDKVKQQALLALTEKRSVKDISANLHISEGTVNRLFPQLAPQFKANYKFLPPVIAFDDFSSGKFAATQMSMALMNPQTHELLDIIESRNSYALRKYFYRYDFHARAKVKLVIVDLYQPYRTIVRDLFPNALIVADRFHIIAQAYRAVNQIRIQTMKAVKESNPALSRALKRYWRYVLKDRTDLDWQSFRRYRVFGGAQLTEVELTDRLTNASEELLGAYNYYQALLHAMHNRNIKSLEALLTIKLTALSQPLRKTQRTLRNHQNEIKRSFETFYSNGPLEGTNNLIKVIKRIAFGYRSFYNFRLRILLVAKNPHFKIKLRDKKGHPRWAA